MSKKTVALALLLSVLLIGWPAARRASARERASEPAFRYVGGTTRLPENCKGKLEVEPTALVFECSGGSLAIPYASVRLMQYRPDISRKVRKMKLRWKVKPQVSSSLLGAKGNRYFTVVYEENGSTGALVLRVSPEAMQPYLAEIDLKVGQRVEVERFEHYD